MDYISTCRTNYFKVKNPTAFTDWVTSVGGEVIEKKAKDGTELVGLMMNNGAPSMKRDGDDDLVEFDFFEELKSHLPDGEVAVWVEAGSEGHRYVTGVAVAIMGGREGDVTISIDEVYEKAAKKFRVPITSITEASY